VPGGRGRARANVTVPDGQPMTLDMTGISQLGASYTIIEAETDGSAPATIDRIEIDTDGTVYGIFENGYSQPLYQLALADVPSPDNLRKTGGNAYSISIESGDVLVGLANSSGYGKILSEIGRAHV